MAVDVPQAFGAFEMEHLRAPDRCPDGKGMISVWFIDTPTSCCLDASDDDVKCNALEIVDKVFPESSGQTEFVHIIRWQTGIPIFRKGRVTEVVELRRQLAAALDRFDFAGDWLDGVSCESAFSMGEQAADRLASRLAQQ
jgi:oxygen-dependent protoporphyrinogen oxidase